MARTREPRGTPVFSFPSTTSLIARAMFDEQQQQQQHQAYAAYGFVPLPFDHFGLFEPAPSFVEPPPSPSIFADMTPIGLSATSSHLSPPAPDLEFDLGLDLGFGSGAALFAESWRALDPFPAAQHEPPPPPPQQQQQNRRSAEQGDANLQQEVVGISFSSSSTVSPLVEKASPGTFDQLDGFASWIQSFGAFPVRARWFRPSLTLLSHRPYRLSQSRTLQTPPTCRSSCPLARPRVALSARATSSGPTLAAGHLPTL